MRCNFGHRQESTIPTPWFHSHVDYYKGRLVLELILKEKLLNFIPL